MTAEKIDQTQSKLSNWMIPVISDLIHFEYETAMKDNLKTRNIIEDMHRGFWGALLAQNPTIAHTQFYHLAKEFSEAGLDPIFANNIDMVIMENLSEMILVRSKTQRTKLRIEIKMLLQAVVLRGAIQGWWHAHH